MPSSISVSRELCYCIITSMITVFPSLYAVQLATLSSLLIECERLVIERPANVQSESFGRRALQFQKAFWKFLRPHTIRGTILGSMAVTARALIESPVVSKIDSCPSVLLCQSNFYVSLF